jgi:hypothetical protein
VTIEAETGVMQPQGMPTYQVLVRMQRKREPMHTISGNIY